MPKTALLLVQLMARRLEMLWETQSVTPSGCGTDLRSVRRSEMPSGYGSETQTVHWLVTTSGLWLGPRWAMLWG